MTGVPEAPACASKPMPATPTLAPINIADLLKNARELPTLPQVAVQVAKLVDDPNTSASQIAFTLSNDQTLTARVLRMANSAFYGAPRKVSTVTDAIILLGMQTIRNMALAVSCYDVLDLELGNYAMRRGDMWRHAFCVGYASQLIARRAGHKAMEEAFVAGLLHDIGKVVINVNLSEPFKQVVQLAQTDIPFTDAERQVLGFTHAEVGACLAEHWKLPPRLVSAIRYHHEPAAQPEDERTKLPAIVHVADALCLMLGIGIGTDGLRYALEDGVFDALGLKPEDAEEIMILVTDFLANSDLVK